MQFRLIFPAEPLRPYIKAYSYFSYEAPADFTQTLVSNGVMTLMFQRSAPFEYEGSGKFQTVIAGASMKSVKIHPRSMDAIGVQFHPWGANRFFPMPAKDFYNSILSPDDLNDKELLELDDRIMTDPDVTRCFNYLDRFFLSRLASIRKEELNIKRARAAITSVITSPEKTVETMADAACLSTKQFRRIFVEHVGMMPKQYLRLMRHKALLCILSVSNKGNREPISLEQLSWKLGYYDASHLLTDFRDIMGCAPSDINWKDLHVSVSAEWKDVYDYWHEEFHKIMH